MPTTYALLNIKKDGVIVPLAPVTSVEAIGDLTATATELNYVQGVTSNVQTQLNGKAQNKVATAQANGLMVAADKKKLDGLGMTKFGLENGVPYIEY